MSAPVTVIMRTKNAAWVVDQALAALFAQDRADFELLVVDSGSTDATLDAVARWPHRLVRIPATAYYPGRVLNAAIEATSSEVVVFQNSDVVPIGPHALDRLLRALDAPGTVAAFARQVPRPEASTWVRRDYAATFPATGTPPDWMRYSLPFAAMRRSAWEAHRFYEDAWGSEDTEWGHWATRAGLGVRYVPECVVMHSHDYTLRQLVGRRFIEGEADAFIYRGDDPLWRRAAATATSIARDVGAHLSARDARGLALSPVRRAVSAWAYHRGHRLGQRRLARGDRDASVGQRVVLERWEK